MAAYWRAKLDGPAPTPAAWTPHARVAVDPSPADRRRTFEMYGCDTTIKRGAIGADASRPPPPRAVALVFGDRRTTMDYYYYC
jgi:hypothetical protein